MNRQELKELIENNPHGYHRTLSGSKYADFRNKLATQYPKLKQAERCYLYAHDMNKPICKNCNKKHTRFVNINEGYKIFCSEKCSIEWHTIHSDMAKRIQEQSRSPPRCSHVHCDNPVVKNKNGLWSQFCSTKCRGIHNSLVSRDKAKKTMMENHGVEHALQSIEIREKLKQQNMKKYGYENPLSSPEIITKTKKTMLKKYGYSSVWQNKEKYQEHVDNIAAQHGHENGKFRNVSQMKLKMSRKIEKNLK